MTSETVGNLFAGVLAACAVTVTVLWVHRELQEPPDAVQVAEVPEWHKYAVRGQQLATDGAPVEVIVFSDFQCSYCASLAWRLDTVRAHFQDEVSIRFRHFPMAGLHPQAGGAALAAECAARQGRFKSYHDILFRDPPSVRAARWEEVASRSSMPDLNAFRQCVRDSVTVPRVRADLEAAFALGVRGTPTVLVNDQYYACGFRKFWRVNSGNSGHLLELRVSRGHPGRDVWCASRGRRG